MSEGSLVCSRCSASVLLGRGECYLAEVNAVADPTPPIFTEDDLRVDVGREIDRLVARIHGLSEEELRSQVFERRLFCLCTRCYAEWSADPFGVGRNT